MQFSNWNPEPIELRVLKHQLANLQCKCLNCIKYNKQFKKNIQNAGVQANRLHGSADRFSQATSDQSIEKPIKVDKASGKKLINIEDEICPTCQLIARFLSGNLNKVLKDEESETCPVICCDKSTDNTIEYLEKSTSTSTQRKSSCDILKMFSNEFDDSKNVKKQNSERVSFQGSEDKNIESQKGISGHCEQEVLIFGGGLGKSESGCGYCVCLEKFVNSIRPPLVD